MDGCKHLPDGWTLWSSLCCSHVAAHEAESQGLDGCGDLDVVHALCGLDYLIIPNNHQAHGFHPSLVDLLAFIGVGGFFLAYLGRNLTSAPSVPVRDPRLPESLAFENF